MSHKDSREATSDEAPLGVIDYLLAAVLAAIVGVMSLQVFCRYILNSSLVWAEELARYLLVWLVFVGAALCTRDRAHIRVNVVLNRLPGRLRTVIRLITQLIVAGFMILMVYLGFKTVAAMSGSESPALRLPVNWVGYAAIPFTFILALGYLIRNAVNAIRSKKASTTEED